MAEKGAAGAELLPLQSQVELELQRSPQFLMKTYQLVDNPAVDDVISWSEGGSSFVVLRPVEFERDILPKHFNIDDFFSFVQRLDYLGFRKIVADRWEFRHACFRRGGEHLLSDICRLEWKMVWSYWLMAAAAPTSMVAGVVTFATLVVRMALGCPEAPVCALVDAMFRLPAKLDKLLVSYCHMLPRGAKDEIPLIKQDLERMIAFIQEHDDSGVEDRSMMVKCMTKEVRELSYDMEDSVDQYVHAADSRRGILSPRRKKYKITRRRSNKATEWLRKKLKWRLWMANKIREFSMRSEEALQQFSRFNHLGGISRSTTAASTRYGACFRSRRPTPNGEPIGIDSPMKKLEAWLGKDGEQKLKMVSVVGSGGIGKTTLVKQLYRRISGQFECRAYVRTSRKPDVRRLLISMLSQIRPHQSPRDWKVYSLIADIRTHLQDKRYLIVIDDVWATQTWDVLCRALPDGNLCSGILITTEVEDVALKCCGYDSKYVLTMKPLGHDDSRRLFFNTAFGSQLVCSPELGEAANGVIRKCAGLPLATVTLASLLVSQMGRQGVLDYINKSLGYGMKQVFDLSYNNLPQHLKACLMYLSIYQEDDVVQKDDVVKQWIAEGFIHATEQKGKEEISRRYFDELISSRMIQPEYRDDNDDVLSFSMHYMVLDLVTHKSIEENFVTAIDHCQTAAILADKVRRLALHFGNAEATSPTNMRLSQVRTLAFFGVFKCLPSIVEFGLLQVLILQLWDDDESISFDLTRISELFRLRYLHVTSNVTLEVQHTQMRGLQYLETLKIDARVSAVPSDIVHLPNLLHLSLPAGTNLPNGIGYMTSLCTLECFDLSVNSAENVQSLGVLTNLRDLRLTCSTLPSSSCYLKSKMDSMGAIIAKLSNLRSLTLEPSCILDSGSSNISISCEGLNRVSSPPLFLQRFEWLPRICTFSRLPNWIRHLYKLCVLKIGIRELARNDINVLGGLPALTVFSLYVRTKPAERIVFDKTGFSVLKYFKFRCSVLCVEFAEDAMPNLRKLKLGFNAHGADQHSTMPVGIEHLLGLTEISAKIGCVCTDDPDRRAAESTLIHAINMHPACPTFNIQCVDEMFSVEEEEYTTLQKQYEIMEGDSIEQHEVLRKGSEEDAHSRACPPCRMGEGSESSSEAQQYNIMENDSNKKHEIQEYSNQYAPGRLPKKRRMVVWNKQVRVRSAQDDLVGDDGFSWRKYRQKLIPGCKYPRVFYQCAHKKKKGCQATKQVQRTSNDPQLFNIACFGDHTCAHIERSPPGSQITHVEVRAGTPDDLFTDMMDTDILSAVAANNIPVTDDMPPYPDRFFDEPGDDSP